MNDLYFDHSASTPVHPRVIDTVGEVMKLHYANPSALHRAGTEAMKLVDRARSSVAERMGARPEEVVFTSGGTESNNLALRGALANANRPVKHMILSAVEHPSVEQCAKQLERAGVEMTLLPPDSSGRIDPEAVRRAIRKETVVVSVMHVNNEVGTVQPIREIGRIVAEHPQIRFHADGVQAIGKVPFSWQDWGVHLYSGSAHKFGGPKGVGFLLVKEGTGIVAQLSGGNQEYGMRSGTLNVPGLVGAAQALRLSLEGAADRRRKMYALRSRLLGQVAAIPELVVNGIGEAGADGPQERTAPHIVNLSYPGMRPEVLVHTLEELGVLVSTQSACSSRDLRPSRVLLAMGHGTDRASGSIRISFGDEHTERDIDTLAERLKATVGKLKPMERSLT